MNAIYYKVLDVDHALKWNMCDYSKHLSGYLSNPINLLDCLAFSCATK